MQSLNEFLAMGGFAVFVWPAYALVAFVMIGLLGISLQGLRGRESELSVIESARAAKAGRADGTGRSDGAGRADRAGGGP